MLVAAFSFSVMTLLVKVAGQTLPSHEIVFSRGIVTLILSYALVRQAGVSPWGNRKRVLLVRGLLGFVALTCYYYAVTQLPIAVVTVLHYTSPIWTSIIAVPLLKEPITKRVCGACLLSFVGVALIARPGFLFGETIGTISLLAVGVALAGSVLSSGAYVFVREASKTDHTTVIIYYFAFISAIGAIPLAWPQAVWPTAWEWLVLAGVGVTTQVAQWFLTRGLSLVPAGRAITVGYSQILFAALWGIIFFEEYPDLLTVVGGCLVVLGTAFVSFPEKKAVSIPIR
jgi:drug/metabolite transporter (DMT)-like permease